MLIRKFVLMGLVLISLSGIGFAQEAPKVVVLPFHANTGSDPDYLKAEIKKIIENYLEANSAELVPAEIPLDQKMATGGYRQLGRSLGADVVIWGSVTWIGEQYSIDAKVLDVSETRDPAVLFVEGQGAENLLSVVQALAGDITKKIFKEERIADVIISGNKRIEDGAIKKRIKTKPGDLYLPRNLTADLKRVYEMGYFDDIRIEYEQGAEGRVVIFNIQEKPTIRRIQIEGNDEYSDEEVKENIDIRTGSIFNIFTIKREIKKIEVLYKDKNYHNAEITYNIESLDNNQADLTFVIEEGEEAKVQEIKFEGNHAFSADELKDLKLKEPGIMGWSMFSWFKSAGELGEMGTTEEGFFSFLTDSGELNMEVLNQDVAKIDAFYQNNGYIDVRIAEPEIEYDKDAIKIKFKIDEGPQYALGTVDIEGDLIRPKKLLLSGLQISRETVVNRSALRRDVLGLTDIYQDQGYFYADIYPRLNRKPEEGKADITLVVKKGELVYFEKILITGNTTTRDKVIRRELPVYEQDLYSGVRLKRGVRNLHRLDFFEDVKVNTLKGSSNDKMLLQVDVKDKPTGSFSFGGGYSSIEQMFITASVTERNLMGRGQVLKLNGEIGGRTTQVNLNFTEPWLFDIPLSASASIYNVEKNYDTYTKGSTGGGVGLGYPVFDYTRLSVSYVYEQNDYTDVEEETAYLAAGQYVMSKVITKLNYDSRDSAVNASQGSDHSLTVTYAGGPLGGDYGFSQYIGETGWYFPLFWGTVGFLHGEAGYVRQNEDGILSEEYRFFLGGINSLRGFEWRSVGPVNGGDKYVLFNAEYIFPIFKKAGLNGVVFYDTGNAFDNEESVDFSSLRSSAGAGFRWNSPLGPIRIEYGHILDPQPGEGDGRWEFSMGAAF